MTVTVGFSAAPQTVQSAVKAVGNSFDELRAKVRAVNGDLSKLTPEIRAQAKEADRLIQAAINRSRKGKTTLAKDIDATGQTGVPFWDLDTSRLGATSGSGERMIQHAARVAGLGSSPTERARVGFMGGILNGGAKALGLPQGVVSEIASAARAWGGAAALAARNATGGGAKGKAGWPGFGQFGGAGGGGGAAVEGEAAAAGGGALGGLAAAAPELLLAFAAYKLGSMLVHDAATGEKKQEGIDIESDHLQRRMRDSTKSFEDFDSSLKDSARGLRISYPDMLSAVSRYASAAHRTGAGSEENAIEGARTGTGLARGYGLSPDQTSSTLGSLSYFGHAQAKELAMSIGDVIAHSGQNADSEEIMRSMAGAVEQLARSANGAAPDLKQLMSLAAGFNATGNTALVGQGGINLLEQASLALSHGGNAGEAGNIWYMRALQRDNPNASIGELHAMMQRGAFTRNPGGKTGLSSMMNSLGIKQGGNLSASDLMNSLVGNELGHQLGMTDDQAIALALNYQKSGDAGIGDSADRLNSMGIDTSTMNMQNMPDIADIVAGKGDAVRQRRGGKYAQMSDNDLIKALASGDSLSTRGSETEKSQADLENAQIDLGSSLVGLTNEVKSLHAFLDNSLNGRGESRAMDAIAANTRVNKSMPAGTRRFEP